MSQNEIMGRVAFAAQYAKPTPNGRESWEEAIDRVAAMHKKKYPEEEERIDWAFSLVKDKRVVPSQRSTQFGGDAILRRNMRIYNCTFSPADRPRFFSEMFWLLLCGCGTGFSVRHSDISRLPRVIIKNAYLSRRTMEYVVQDSIEGWAEALQALLDSYFFTDYFDHSYDYELEFNFKKVRPKGSPISSGGIAPGPAPLETCLQNIKKILHSRFGQRLRSIDVFDICMELSAAVLSGGVRRSASICLFDNDDHLMLNAKTGEWWKFAPNRAYANISATIPTDGRETKSMINRVVKLNREWGEPGVYFSDSPDFGTNPCCEIGLYPYFVQSAFGTHQTDLPLSVTRNRSRLEMGGWVWRSGWAVCNLTEINMEKNQTEEKFFEACEAASYIGTLQAGYTETGYLGKVTQTIIEQEALIGVSLTGMHANPLSFVPSILRDGAAIVEDINHLTAKRIGINYASRLTCIKPSGNTSTILGTSSGIHPFHADRYIRTIRLSKINPIWQLIKEQLPEAIIDLEGDTGIIQFACVGNGTPRDHLSARDFLESVALVQSSWVEYGSKGSRVEGLSHNVSNTCTVKDDEWGVVSDWLWKNRRSVRGVALLSDYGDTVYENAPYQTVKEGTKQEKEWERLLTLDWSKIDLTSVGGGNDAHLMSGCDGLKCQLPTSEL
jgi:ribonucleoside-triphosphate reductase (thioredoxin)